MPYQRCSIHRDWDAIDCPICDADLELWRREFRRIIREQGGQV